MAAIMSLRLAGAENIPGNAVLGAVEHRMLRRVFAAQRPRVPARIRLLIFAGVLSIGTLGLALEGTRRFLGLRPKTG